MRNISKISACAAFTIVGSSLSEKVYAQEGQTSALVEQVLQDWSKVDIHNSIASVDGVAFGNKTYVVLSYDSIFVSADMLMWEKVQESFSRVNDIVFAKGLFVLAHYSGIHVSFDGKEWITPEGLNTSEGFSNIEYGNGAFVATNSHGSIYCSEDGIQWGQVHKDPEKQFNDVSYSDGEFVALYDNNKFGRSIDGKEWVFHENTDSSWFFNSVVKGNGRYVAVGGAGVVGYSNDLEEWTIGRMNFVLDSNRSVRFIDDRFVLAGDQHYAYDTKVFMYSSSDGVEWENEYEENGTVVSGQTIASNYENVKRSESLQVVNGVLMHGAGSGNIHINNYDRLDTDRDGVSDQYELIAGTDPLSANDRLKGSLVSVDFQLGKVVFGWESVVDRSYCLETFDEKTGSWQVVSNPIRAMDVYTEYEYQVPISEMKDRGLYRVKVLNYSVLDQEGIDAFLQGRFQLHSKQSILTRSVYNTLDGDQMSAIDLDQALEKGRIEALDIITGTFSQEYVDNLNKLLDVYYGALAVLGTNVDNLEMRAYFEGKIQVIEDELREVLGNWKLQFGPIVLDAIGVDLNKHSLSFFGDSFRENVLNEIRNGANDLQTSIENLPLIEHMSDALVQMSIDLAPNPEAALVLFDEALKEAVFDFEKALKKSGYNFADFVGNTFIDIGDIAIDSTAEAGRKYLITVLSAIRGEQPASSTALQIAGTFGTHASDIVFSPITAGLTQSLAFSELDQEIQKLGNTQAGQTVLLALALGNEAWDILKEEDPVLARDIEALFGLAELTGILKVARFGKNLVDEISDADIARIRDGIQKFNRVSDLSKEIADNFDTISIEKLREFVDTSEYLSLQFGENLRGHVFIRHVDVSEAELTQRMQENIRNVQVRPNGEVEEISPKTTFTNEALFEEAFTKWLGLPEVQQYVREVIDVSRTGETILRDGDRKQITIDLEKEVGTGVEIVKQQVDGQDVFSIQPIQQVLTKVDFAILPDGKGGWFLKTGFPVK